MALRRRSIPPEVTHTIDRWKSSQGLTKVRRPGSPHSRLPGPYPAYYLGLLAIVSREDASNAVFVGWKSFVPSSKGHLHMTVHALSGKHFRISRHRPLLENELELEVLRKLSRPNAHKGRCFELRALNIPPLVNLAIWLKSQDAGGDLFVPVDTCVKALVPSKSYTEGEFFPLLLEPARDLMELGQNEPSSLRPSRKTSRTQMPTTRPRRTSKPSPGNKSDSSKERTESTKRLTIKKRK